MKSTTIINSLHEYMNPEILCSILHSLYVHHILHKKHIKLIIIFETVF